MLEQPSRCQRLRECNMKLLRLRRHAAAWPAQPESASARAHDIGLDVQRLQGRGRTARARRCAAVAAAGALDVRGRIVGGFAAARAALGAHEAAAACTLGACMRSAASWSWRVLHKPDLGRDTLMHGQHGGLCHLHTCGTCVALQSVLVPALYGLSCL